jgi:hypothetical protein
MKTIQGARTRNWDDSAICAGDAAAIEEGAAFQKVSKCVTMQEPIAL